LYDEWTCIIISQKDGYVFMTYYYKHSCDKKMMNFMGKLGRNGQQCSAIRKRENHKGICNDKHLSGNKS